MNNISNRFGEYGFDVEYEILAPNNLTPEEKHTAVVNFVEANPTFQPPSGSVVRFDIDELKPLHD